MKKLWQRWSSPHFQFWLMFSLTILNVGLVWLNLKMNRPAQAMLGLFWAGFCAVFTFLQYLRTLAPKDD